MIPWTHAAASVCGEGGHRAGQRPASPSCRGSSGSRGIQSRSHGKASPHGHGPQQTCPAHHAILPLSPRHGPYLSVLRLPGTPGPQTLQKLQLPKVHVEAGGAPAPASPKLPGELHSCACQPAGEMRVSERDWESGWRGSARPLAQAGTESGCGDRPSGSAGGGGGSPGSRRAHRWRLRTQQKSAWRGPWDQKLGRQSGARSGSRPPRSSLAASLGEGCRGEVREPSCLVGLGRWGTQILAGSDIKLGGWDWVDCPNRPSTGVIYLGRGGGTPLALPQKLSSSADPSPGSRRSAQSSAGPMPPLWVDMKNVQRELAPWHGRLNSGFAPSRPCMVPWHGGTKPGEAPEHWAQPSQSKTNKRGQS